ncbi:hypothetical protein BTO30_13915 [Domibacillus antri]|uniref:YneQ n=1 Tax=Domibacillus antri TaxID=1714264 RepID=A0A1Q8Q2N2_9BACI|nr:hypothetical protein [Domibacillus antri]OLN21577.1 hypothetical protein BTO30_13915 [Domibacillus antri]
MAFGINRIDVERWKRELEQGHITFLTHYWYDERFPHCRTVTKAGCIHVDKLIEWGDQYGLRPDWIDMRNPSRPHYDLLGDKQLFILKQEGLHHHIRKFHLE